MSETDKMIARKEGRVGYLIFNNPERHNAVSLEMWAKAGDILRDFAKDDGVRVVAECRNSKSACLSPSVERYAIIEPVTARSSA